MGEKFFPSSCVHYKIALFSRRILSCLHVCSLCRSTFSLCIWSIFHTSPHVICACTFTSIWNTKSLQKKPVCVPGHAAEVKLLWTQLCMRMSKYMWTSMLNYFWNFLKSFSKTASAYIFISCINLSKFVKFVKIVFNAYLNFIKLSNISKISWEASSYKIQSFSQNLYKFIHNLPKFLKHFLNYFKISLKFLRMLFFFQHFILKTNTFF